MNAEQTPASPTDLQPWGCLCGNWTDQATCEACGRKISRPDQGGQDGSE